MKLPDDVKYILDKFYDNGYESFIVGGCVRDSLLNITPKDYDITTNALPNTIIELFPKTIPTGINHGTITVIINNTPYEITTYRVDGDYIDNRRPKDVKFVTNIQEDLARRDFTINALAYSPYLGFKDFFNGEIDLKNRIIKCVGNPNKRFTEDALRILRAIRFSCQLDFNIDSDTMESIKINYKLIPNISIERIRDEFSKILMSDLPSKGLSLLRDLGILNLFLPEFCDLKEINFYDIYDDLHDNYKVLDMLPKKLHIRLAGLFYKMRNNNNIQDICKNILKNLKYNNKIIHDTSILLREVTNIPNHYTNKELKMFINRTSIELIFDLLSLQKCYLSFLDEYSTEYIDILKNNIEDILISKEPLTLKDLALNGRDIIDNFCVVSGKNIGIILCLLLERVLENPDINNKDTLLNLAQQIIKNN